MTSRPRRALAVAVIALAVAGGSACSDPEVHEASNDLPPRDERAPGDPEVQTSGPTVVEMSSYLMAPGAARGVIDDVTAALGPVLVTSFNLYDRHAVFEAQDPGNDEHIDSYTFRDGEIIDTRPVRLTQSGIDELPGLLFALTDVNWDAVPTLASDAVTRLQIEDGEVSHLIVDRPSPGQPVLLRFYVDGPRRSGILDATADGRVIEARLF